MFINIFSYVLKFRSIADDWITLLSRHFFVPIHSNNIKSNYIFVLYRFLQQLSIVIIKNYHIIYSNSQTYYMYIKISRIKEDNNTNVKYIN